MAWHGSRTHNDSRRRIKSGLLHQFLHGQKEKVGCQDQSPRKVPGIWGLVVQGASADTGHAYRKGVPISYPPWKGADGHGFRA